MIISAFALLAAFTQAAPAPIQNLAPREIVEITFEGATPSAYFIEGFPTNGQVVAISNVLSISHISSPGGASCTFYGIDGSVTKVTGTELVDVGPPQTQISGSCWAI